METIMQPRIVIAGTNSGVGKTTIVTGLLAYLHSKGYAVQPFKVGPDYIDPGFHEKAAGRSSYNLDTWMTPEDRLIPTFTSLSKGADISIIEGVMGLYDGGANGVSSTADIAKKLKAPVILVLDCKSVGYSIAATALGFREYDKDVHIAGVILNRLGSSRHEAMVRDVMEKIHMPVIGAFHRDDALKTPERHLGLTPVTEIETQNLIAHMGEAAGKWIDTDALLAIAKKAPPLKMEEEKRYRLQLQCRIGVAKDEGFSFYYPTSLESLEKRGATLVPFSPLHDKEIPDVDGLIFGGGFPEMFLTQLEGNKSMKESIRKAAAHGMPIYAECGGLMYLCDKIQGFDGDSYTMVGLVPGVCEMQKKLQRVGYVTGKALRDSIIAQKGDTLKGHEFHFSTLRCGEDFPWAYTLQGTRQKEGHLEGYAKDNVLASYLHLSFDGNPKAAEFFMNSCMVYKGKLVLERSIEEKAKKAASLDSHRKGN